MKTPDPNKPSLSRDVWETGGVPDENAPPSSIAQYGSEAFAKQREVLLEALDPFLSDLNDELADLEVPLSRRPLSATPLLLDHGPLQFFAGDTPRSPEAIKAEPDGPEFRVLFGAVHTWYVRRYGAAAVRGSGNPPLVGAVVIRGAPYLIEAPLTRRKVADPGETAWIYFDDAVHPTEQPLDWVRNPPAPDSLTPEELEALLASVRKTVGVLRHLTFRQSGHEEDDREARQLIPAAIAYLGSAAKRMVEGADAERGPAWSDLQMAAEAVLKAVIRDRSGTQPFDHDLTRLLRTATTFGVDFDDDRLKDWPKFSDVSHWRYGQTRPPGFARQFEAYLTVMDLARACAVVLPVAVKPGIGLLIRYAPWKFRTPDSTAADEGDS